MAIIPPDFWILAAFLILIASGCPPLPPLAEDDENGTDSDNDIDTDTDSDTDRDTDTDADSDTDTDADSDTDTDTDADTDADADECSVPGDCADDGNQCTAADCINGVCVNVTQVGASCTLAASAPADHSTDCYAAACNSAAACVLVTTALDGAACTDNAQAATVGWDDDCYEHVCATGVCTATALGATTICDDGAFCTAGDTCDGAGACVPGEWDPCDFDEDCYEAGDTCCTLEHAKVCGDDNDIYWLDSCSRVGEKAGECSDTHGECVSGACECRTGWGGFECDTCVRYAMPAPLPPPKAEGDGLTWATATTELKAYMKKSNDYVVNTPEVPFCEVWAKEGTYYVYDDALTNTLQLYSYVHLYGGFDGAEADRSQRNWIDNETILSGSMLSKAPTAVQHVVTGADDTILDGFTITGGQAYGYAVVHRGGGMVNVGVSPTVSNCIFDDNYAGEYGGGMYNESNSPIVTDCTFVDNVSSESGGGMANLDAAPLVSGCSFVNNRASEAGGGMYNHESHPTIENCNFMRNYVLGGSSPPLGGGMHNTSCGDESAPMTIDGTTFIGNYSEGEGGGLHNNSSYVEVTNCVFEGNRSDGPGGGLGNNDSTSVITNSVFVGNWADSSGGGINAGSSDMSVVNCSFYRNTGINSGGACYNEQSMIEFYNSILWHDWAKIEDEEWEIAGSKPEVYYSDIELPDAGVWEGPGNINEDPAFSSSPLVSGTWDTAPVYHGSGFSYRTKFTDTSASWTTDAHAGRLVRLEPIGDQAYWTYIIANTATEVFVWGDMSGFGEVDDAYAIYSFDIEPGAGSPCIDAADGDEAPFTDLEGSGRYDDPTADAYNCDGGPDCISYADMGAYEYRP